MDGQDPVEALKQRLEELDVLSRLLGDDGAAGRSRRLHRLLEAVTELGEQPAVREMTPVRRTS